MAGKTSAEREALDAQNRRIMAVFTRAGFDFIAPDIVQPADMFLESFGREHQVAHLCLHRSRGRRALPEARSDRTRVPLPPLAREGRGSRGQILLFGPGFSLPARRIPAASIRPNSIRQALNGFPPRRRWRPKPKSLISLIKAVDAAGSEISNQQRRFGSLPRPTSFH